MCKITSAPADRGNRLGPLGRLAADEKGNVVITTAIVFVFMAGAVGAAASYSTASSTRTSMQGALDAAVLAGMVATDTGQDPIATANNVFESNVSRFAQNNASDIKASFTLQADVLSGVATGSVNNPFGNLIGSKVIPVDVHSAATKQTISVCVLGLNGLDNGAFDINGSKAQFNASCAVQANSNSKSGMTEEGHPTAKAKKFGVSGGHKGESFSPPPSDGSAKIDDPYASLPFPYYDSCDSTKKDLDIKSDTTLSPGTYCGGIHIGGDSVKVTLQPGIYVMVGGSFWADAGSIVTGDRVMIAFTGKGATLRLGGGSSMTVTSPTSGTYMNMQFMQDNNDPNTHGLWCSLGGNGGDDSAKLQFDGVAYFPTQNFWTFGNSVVNANSPSMAIVADKVWTQGSATVNVTNNNTRNLAVSAPKTTFGARLIK
jgi:Flp pilus assembly protein TadG